VARTMFFAIVLVVGTLVRGDSLGAPPGFPFAADQVFQALEVSYPGWVSVRRDGPEPVVSVDGCDFVWAQGRLLPPDRAGEWERYAPQPFYPYPADPPHVEAWTDDQVTSAEARIEGLRTHPVRRDPGFFDALWSVHDRGSADAAQRRIRFLGARVTVHGSLVAPLSRVEARLQSARTQDPTLDQFLQSLAGFDGYNWRNIAGTESRSNHAYGSALDVIPTSFQGKNPYWLWSNQDGGPWYRRAWAHRWEPPSTFVKAFEAEGFVWGGKWLLFDTIHFEYRPEILVLNNLR